LSPITESLTGCGILNEKDKELNEHLKGFIDREERRYEHFIEHGQKLQTTTSEKPKDMIVATLFNAGNVEFRGRMKYCRSQCGDIPEMERLYLYLLKYFKRKYAGLLE
jgi:hypothetical protein